MDGSHVEQLDPAGSIEPFTEDENMFRQSVRAFYDRELEPNCKRFEAQGYVDRDLWLKAGRAGILGCSVPELYGGPGGSELCGVIRSHELGRSPGGATVGSAISAAIATNILLADEHIAGRGLRGAQAEVASRDLGR